METKPYAIAWKPHYGMMSGMMVSSDSREGYTIGSRDGDKFLRFDHAWEAEAWRRTMPGPNVRDELVVVALADWRTFEPGDPRLERPAATPPGPCCGGSCGSAAGTPAPPPPVDLAALAAELGGLSDGLAEFARGLPRTTGARDGCFEFVLKLDALVAGLNGHPAGIPSAAIRLDRGEVSRKAESVIDGLRGLAGAIEAAGPIDPEIVRQSLGDTPTTGPGVEPAADFPATSMPGDGPWEMAEKAAQGTTLGLTVDGRLRAWRPGDVFVGHSTLLYDLRAGDRVVRDPANRRIRIPGRKA